MKVVINTCIGGFGLSKTAYKFLGLKWDNYGHGTTEEIDYCYNDKNRASPKLVRCVEQLGEKANGTYARLKVVEIPDDVDWYIYRHEIGPEVIHEKHRTWSEDGEHIFGWNGR